LRASLSSCGPSIQCTLPFWYDLSFLANVSNSIWGLADGSYTLTVDEEILAYAVLDVLAKPVFGFWLLFTHDGMAESTISLDGFWMHGLSNEGAIRVGDDDGA
jgi:hypothetical protein